MKVPVTSRAQRYLSVLARWLCITFVVFGIILWTGKYITENVLPKTYMATAEVQMAQAIGHAVVPAIDRNAPVTAPFQIEFATIESPAILLPVINDLGLEKAWAKRVYKSDKEKPSDQEALAYLRKNLKLDYIRGANIINITALSDEPHEAADIANAIADRYKAKLDLDEDQRMTRGLDSLREQIKEEEKVVEEKKTSMETARQKLTEGGIALPKDSGPEAKLEAYRDAQRSFQEQQSILEALKVKLQEDEADAKHLHMRSPVRIISRAVVPEYPSSPNKLLYFIATVGIAALVSLVAGCFVEVIMLIRRAAEEEKT